MEVKMFELRDRSTFIPVLCVRLSSRNEAEGYLLSRSGYGRTSEEHQGYVLMMGIVGGTGEVKCDPFDWNSNRTRVVCHQHIIEHWGELKSGQVVDCEFITGESDAPKLSEATL